MSDEQADREARLTARTGLEPAAREAVEGFTIVLMACADLQVREQLMSRLDPVDRHIVRMLLDHIDALLSERVDPATAREAISMRADMTLMVRAVENGQPVNAPPGTAE